MNKVKSTIKQLFKSDKNSNSASDLAFPHLEKQVLEANNIKELMKVFGWKKEPVLDRPDVYDFDYPEDLNERRIRDAEVLGAAMANANAKSALEIGTANGMGTVLMAANAPKTKIYTINIPPTEAEAGEGGKLITVAMQEAEIGIEFRKRNLKNIEQILANTATWEPNIGEINVAFIDGSHDTEFVYNDTKKILPFMPKGSFILWHDFNLELTKKHDWIAEVCLGVEWLYRDGLIHGRTYHLRDSWIGIHQIT